MHPPLTRPAIRSYLRLRGSGVQHLRAMTLPFPPHADREARLGDSERLIALLAAQAGFLGAGVRSDAAGHPVVISAWSSSHHANRAMRATTPAPFLPASEDSRVA